MDDDLIVEGLAVLGIFPEDSDGNSLAETRIVVQRLEDGHEWTAEQGDEPGQQIVVDLPPGDYSVTAHPSTDERVEVTRTLSLRPGYQGITIILGTPGQPYYLADGMKVYFDRDDHAFLLIAHGDDAIDRTAEVAAKRGLQFDILPSFRISAGPNEFREQQQTPDIGFVHIRLPDDRVVSESGEFILEMANELRDQGLRATPALVVRRGDHPIQGLTNEFVVHFREGVAEERALELIREFNLTLIRRLPYADDAYLVSHSELSNYEFLETANRLNEISDILAVEPNMINQMETHQFIPNDPLWTNLDHLTHIGCPAAWERLGSFHGNNSLRGGDPGITIAVFDSSGVSVTQPDLLAPVSDGEPKLVLSYKLVGNMALQEDDKLGGVDIGAGISPRDHGTQCAGIATAAFDNGEGVAGVAPNCHLIGGRLPSVCNEAIVSAALAWAGGLDAGIGPEESFPEPLTQPAAVISNSWGYKNAPLTTTMRKTLDNLAVKGRGGLGTVVVFSIGNIGYKPFGQRFTYAAYYRTFAVGASTNGTVTSPVNSEYGDPFGNQNNLTVAPDCRALYSPYGYELDLVAPSCTTYGLGTGDLIDPLGTTVRKDRGNLDGCAPPANCLHYAKCFGGTSAAAPMVAGAAALILSVSKSLRRTDVFRILRDSAVRIDPTPPAAIGDWTDRDGDGVKEFSRWYGYGRLDVDAAVAAAIALVDQ